MSGTARRRIRTCKWSTIWPEFMVVLAGDRVYKKWITSCCCASASDPAREFTTVGCLEVPRAEASAFGIMWVDNKGEIAEFLEKPSNPPCIPRTCDTRARLYGHLRFSAPRGSWRNCTATRRSRLVRAVFGKDVIPYMVKNAKAVAHRFSDSCVRSEAKGSLLARCGNHRRLLGSQYRSDRPVASSISTIKAGRFYETYAEITPPAKFVHDEEEGGAARSLR